MKNYEYMARLRRLKATTPSINKPSTKVAAQPARPTRSGPEPKSRERAAVALACGLKDRGGVSLERHAVLLAKRVNQAGLIVK